MNFVVHDVYWWRWIPNFKQGIRMTTHSTTKAWFIRWGRWYISVWMGG